MKIAVIGAGLCGLASTWHLHQIPNVHVTVFDPAGPGGGTSGIASGLLHCYVGAHAKLNWKGREGLEASKKLLRIAEHAIGRPVASHTGLIRLVTEEEQKTNFALCAEKFSDVLSLSEDDPKLAIHGLNRLSGVFIESAVTVNCPLYLKGLWKACENLGANFERQAVSSTADLKDFDRILITAGAATKRFQEAEQLPLTLVKGQILELECQTKFPCPLNSKGYLIKQADTNFCIAGATYEKNFSSDKPDLEAAIQEILPKLSSMIPDARHFPIIGCRAGVRVSAPGHLPIIKQLSEKCWTLTGMGSKGLLYHAIFGEEISRIITSN